MPKSPKSDSDLDLRMIIMADYRQTLSMLDSKASQLTSANAIILAVSLFFFGYVQLLAFRQLMIIQLIIIVASIGSASLVTYPSSSKRALNVDHNATLDWMISQDELLIAKRTALLRFAYLCFWASVSLLIVAVLWAFGVFEALPSMGYRTNSTSVVG